MATAPGMNSLKSSITLANISIESLNYIREKRCLNEYRQMIFLEEAKNLLLCSDMSMTGIIGMLGLSNRSYFYRLFKKAYGMTPVEYREAHRR